MQGEGDAVYGEGAYPSAWRTAGPWPSLAALSPSVMSPRSPFSTEVTTLCRGTPPSGQAGSGHQGTGDPGVPATSSPAPTPRLTTVGVRWPSKVREGAGLAGEGYVVGHETTTAREAVFRVAASHLRTAEWARQSGRARLDPPPSPPSNSTHQASVSPAQWHDGAGKARGQSSVARQQPVHVGRRAHRMAAQHVDGLVQVVLHLVLLWGGGGGGQGLGPLGPCTAPRGLA